MRVLFLDIDGVLNSADYMRNTPGAFDRDDWLHMLDPVPCARLARVIAETGAGIVISSSWRIAKSVDEMRELLRRRNIDADVIGATPTRLVPYRVVADRERGHEIQAWLNENHGVTCFAIVDDDSDMAHLEHRLVQTSWSTGLLDEHVEKLVEMLTA